MENEIVKTTSPICVPIVIAFLEFLSHVEGSTSTEINYVKDVEVALKDIFRISESHMESKNPQISLLKLFKDHIHLSQIPSSSPQGAVMRNINTVREAQGFDEFYVKMEASRFFHFIFGENYGARKTRAHNIFKEALQVMVELGTQTFSLEILADAVHTLGHRAYKLRLYYKSVELYTCAIALFSDNAGYFCDRAKGLTKIERYQEAINDCYRALEFKPNYIEAYLAIGCIYLEQGQGLDAVCHGFIRALQIDSNNANALEKLEFAMFKLKHQLNWMTDELDFFKNYDFIPISSYQHTANYEQGKVHKLRAVPPEEEGGDASERPPWKLVDHEMAATIGGTVADFVDLLGCYRVPLE